MGNSAEISVVELRKMCEEFVKGYINDQRTQFKRLGVIGEWDKPYITLNHEFEAEQIRVFAEMATKGYIYKGLSLFIGVLSVRLLLQRLKLSMLKILAIQFM